jgi:hypothetical protein
VLAFTQSVSANTQGWKLDSGTTQHICNTSTGFTEFKSYGVPKLLQVGKAEVFLSALGEGTIALQIPAAAGGSTAATSLILTRVWYCPDCPFQLISTRRLVEAGYSIQLTRGGASILTPAGQPALWLAMDASGLCTCMPVNATAQDTGLAGAAGIQLPVVEGSTLSPGMCMMWLHAFHDPDLCKPSRS